MFINAEKKHSIDKSGYTGVPKNEDKLIVQKSNPLQSLSETGMSLSEFKILDAYLSRIDSHDEEKRYVRFEKGELERILGVDRIRREELSKRLDNLFQVVTIRDDNKRNGFTKIALFEKAEAFQDDKGLWQVDLACTPSAMEYIFNIEHMGYLPYMLKNVIELTSRYSYVLYLYLERNRWRKIWKEDIEELKKILNCTAESYKKYKEFNDKILKKCHKELNEKTTLHFSYIPTDKKGRSYTAVQFTIETLFDRMLVYEQEENNKIDNIHTEQLSFEDGYDDEKDEVDYGGELADLLGNVSCDDEFTPEQIRVIQDLVIKALGSGLDHLTYCDYLTNKVHMMNLYQPKNRYSYLVKMIKNDIKDPEDVW